MEDSAQHSLLPTPRSEENRTERSVFAVTNACAGCGACIKTCPEKAIQPAPRGYPVPLIVLDDRCSGCAECAEVCPVSACIEVLLEQG